MRRVATKMSGFSGKDRPFGLPPRTDPGEHVEALGSLG
jgi:hypothetical protein